MRGASVALLLVVTAATGARAQTLPQAGPEDLTIPPELRGAPAAGPPPPASPPPRMRPAVHRAAGAAQGQASTPAKARAAAPPHPVDFGVVVRGGSATPHVYGPIGTSEAVQESGSAVGAAMRFGF